MRSFSIDSNTDFLHASYPKCSIPERKKILDAKKTLLQSMNDLQKAIDYIDWKQSFYDDVLSGKTKYYSNLIKVDED